MLTVAAVHLGEATDDVEAEPGAAALAALPELREHPEAHLGRDALALVVDDDPDAGLVAQLTRAERDERDPHGALAVPDGVLDQVGDHLGELVGVGVDLGQVVGDLEGDRAGRPGRDRLDDPAGEQAGVAGPRVQLEPAGVDAGHVEELGDQPAQPVGVGGDRGEHQLLLLVVEPVPAVEQGLHEPLDAGQRRAQLVRDRGDQVGALPVQPLPAAAGADGHRDLGDRLVQGRPVDLRRDQDLLAVRQQPGLLGDGGAGRQPVVGAVVADPGVVVLVAQREHLVQRPAHAVTGPGPASGPPPPRSR